MSMGADNDVLEGAIDFSQIAFGGAVFTWLLYIFSAVLRAIEINADVILKGTRVDGIYNEDPEKNKEAIKFDDISFEETIRKGLKIMDTTAFTLSKENKLPIIVFDMNTKGNLTKVIMGEKIGTKVSS